MSRELREAFETPDTKRRYVRRLFARIANRYDLVTVVLSYGRDRRWKEQLAAMSGAGPATLALDLACGTGDIAFALADRGARVVGLDVTFGMIEIARAKAHASHTPAFLVGDMMALPFPDGAFDVITTGYGIRNVPQIVPALHEMHRVLRPAGVLLTLDFNRPSNRLVRAVYLGYLTIVGSILGWLLHRDPDTYRYIAASVGRYPGARGLAGQLERAGFTRCRVVPLLGGLMAINTARRPSG